jgi:hypothetical protein
MRRIIGTIGATLAVVAVTAVSAAPANAAGQAPGWSAQLLPYIEQDNLFRATSAGGLNISMGDGSVRFLRDSAVSLQTWQAMGTRTGGEVVSSDW